QRACGGQLDEFCEVVVPVGFVIAVHEVSERESLPGGEEREEVERNRVATGLPEPDDVATGCEGGHRASCGGAADRLEDDVESGIRHRVGAVNPGSGIHQVRLRFVVANHGVNVSAASPGQLDQEMADASGCAGDEDSPAMQVAGGTDQSKRNETGQR